jgi:hypothetical protein
MNKEIKPLWRKLNKEKSYKTHDLKVGAEFDKNTKEGVKRSMRSDNRNRGIKDYTPLYKYLIKHVGEDFDKICSDIYPRIDDRDAIWHIIADNENKKKPIARVGNNSYYNELYVDENNILQIVDPELKNSDLYPSCDCCTHSFNGKPFVNKWVYGKDLLITY